MTGTSTGLFALKMVSVKGELSHPRERNIVAKLRVSHRVEMEYHLYY